jgi:flagellar motor switch protein FliG
MASMQTLNNVSTDSIRGVFDDFAFFVEHEPVLLEGGADYLRDALDRAVGQEKAMSLLGELPEQEVVRPVTLGNVDPKTLANVLESEHPQTIALLLANMDARQAATVLGHMSEEIQQEVMGRVARLERVTPDVIRDIEASIVAELHTIGTSEQREVKGTEQAAALLNNMDRQIGVDLLTRLEEVDESLAVQIRQSMFIFEDLSGVDDRGMQAILKEISSDALLLALKTASPDLKDKFFRNMSSRAADMMRDDLAAMGPARLSDVETAQKEIAQIALRLQEEGTIVIAGAGEDVV